ncbi:MAG: hypothetical protein IKV41_03185 [Oscillospiraceae bacterium]|nr:hypothetical protein [Oscillospiraceae bacterium]
MRRSLGKIKRHKKIYSRSLLGLDPLRVIIIIAAAVLLFSVGWALYTPVYNLITGNGSEPAQPEQVEAIPSEQPSEPEPSPETPPAAEVLQEAPHIRGAYLPYSIVFKEDAFSAALDDLKAKGFTHVLVDMKTEQGMLLYRSMSQVAVSSQLIVANPLDAQKTASLIREKGLVPMAKMYAFRDPIASINNLEMAVHYQNTEWAWLDDSQQNGGKSWLNPYSADARDYISTLCVEVASLGFDGIVLYGVQFPQGYALDLCGYGDEAASKTKSQVLQEFTSKLRSDLEKVNTKLYVYAEGTHLLNSETTHLGEDRWAHLNNGAAVNAMPASFGTSFDIVEGNTTTRMETPVIAPKKTVQTVASMVNPHLSPTADHLFILQAYTSLDFSGVYFLEYTQTEIDDQISGLNAAGAEDYILYNPQGKY